MSEGASITAATAAPWSWLHDRGARLWLVSLCFFLAVGALDATHGFVGYRLGGGPVLGLTVRGQPMSWSDFFARSALSWLVVGFLTPIAIMLMRRFPLDGTFWRRHLLVHLVGAVAFSFTFILLAAVFRYHLFLKHEITTTYGALVIRYYAVYFNTFFLVYWALAAAWAAFRYHARHRDALVLERDLAEARLQALQAQLRPHFLFNSLNAIMTLAREGRSRTVVRMLGTLAELLRVSFRHSGTELVPLRDEVAFTRRYLDLERMRFADRLAVDVRLDPATEEVAVPRFVLQPIVENAVRYGVAASERAGRITITAWRYDGAVELCVDDTGPGPAADAVEGTGLGNTRRRLEHAFGHAAHLELGRAPQGGCRVRVRLPAGAAEPVPAGAA